MTSYHTSDSDLQSLFTCLCEIIRVDLVKSKKAHMRSQDEANRSLSLSLSLSLSHTCLSVQTRCIIFPLSCVLSSVLSLDSLLVVVYCSSVAERWWIRRDLSARISLFFGARIQATCPLSQFSLSINAWGESEQRTQKKVF